jgi:uncharacterized membrane protein YtjA (UPF0391 family)
MIDPPIERLQVFPHALNNRPKEASMLYWALMFFVVALVAALFGFTGIATAAAGIAKILFFVFLVLFVVSLFMHLFGGRRGRPPVP